MHEVERPEDNQQLLMMIDESLCTSLEYEKIIMIDSNVQRGDLVPWTFNPF